MRFWLSQQAQLGRRWTLIAPVGGRIPDADEPASCRWPHRRRRPVAAYAQRSDPSHACPRQRAGSLDHRARPIRHRRLRPLSVRRRSESGPAAAAVLAAATAAWARTVAAAAAALWPAPRPEPAFGRRDAENLRLRLS